MSKNARDRRPYIKPVTRLELSEKNIKFRWIAIAVLLAIAAVSIGYGFSLALRTEAGWEQVNAGSDTVNCSSDFVLMYDFGAGDGNPTVVNKQLEQLYTQLTEEAYRIFFAEAEGTDNLYSLNAHINETVTVAPELYRALEQIGSSGSRYVYMAPVTALYAPVFLSANDAEAALYDPMRNRELLDLAERTAAYCNDPEMVSLELLGDQQVRLNVAAEYHSFAQENGIERFLDLGWMENAFIIDYMAQALADGGFVYGYLSSYDGFTRNLDPRGDRYSLNIFHCVDNTVYMPGVLEYSGPMSLVSLRSFPMSDRDQWNYYAYTDGQITSVYLDPENGQPGACVDALTAYSGEVGCAEILLKLAPVFVGESFDACELEILEQEGIQSLRCYGKGIVCTDPEAVVQISDETYSLTVSNVA